MIKMKKARKFIIGGLMLLITLAIVLSLTLPKKEEVKAEPKEEQKQEEIVKAETSKVEEVNEEDIEFKMATEEILNNTSSLLQELKAKFTDASNDPDLTSDPIWRQGIVDVFKDIRAEQEKLSALNVPDELADVHSDNVEGFQFIMDSRDRILQGIDFKDPNHINEGAELMAKGAGKFTDSENKLDEISND
jgi:hypothetical protein